MLLKIALIISAVAVYTTNGLRCWECDNASSNKECLEKGRITVCDKNEGSCQNTVRISHGKTMLFKTCKQTQACMSNMRQNGPITAFWFPIQCSNQPHQTVCRCCCQTNNCNDKALACRGSRQRQHLEAVEQDLHWCGKPLCSNHGRCYKGSAGFRCACNAGHEGDKCQYRSRDIKNLGPTHIKLSELRNPNYVTRLMQDQGGRTRVVGDIVKPSELRSSRNPQPAKYDQRPTKDVRQPVEFETRYVSGQKVDPREVGAAKIVNSREVGAAKVADPMNVLTAQVVDLSAPVETRLVDTKELIRQELEFLKNMSPAQREASLREIMENNPEAAEVIRENKDLQDLLLRSKNAKDLTRRINDAGSPSLMYAADRRSTRESAIDKNSLDWLLDIDECELYNGMGNCKNSLRCENTIGSFKCHCKRGWSGKYCEDREKKREE